MLFCSFFRTCYWRIIIIFEQLVLRPQRVLWSSEATSQSSMGINQSLQMYALEGSKFPRVKS